jgi:membrane protease YdiL (CAAX protease family)
VGAATTRLLQSIPSLVAAAQLTQLALPAKVMIALGAGLYEELLFRVVIVSGLIWIARRGAGLGPAAAALAATIGGALLFALAHHVGSLGEPLTLNAFTFRTLAGLFFSGLYVLRGFGITAWTHALYDVMVLVLR